MVASTASPRTTADHRLWRRRASTLLLKLDAALRLGPRPVALLLLHRARCAAGLPRRALAAAESIAGDLQGARFLPETAPPAPALPGGAAARILAAAADLQDAPDWHGPFDPATPSLRLDLFRPGDIRPVWEASRFADLLLLVQAARLQPGAGHLARAEDRLSRWCSANPAFRGPAWACGQEAALRALSLALGLVLLDADRVPPPAARALLRLCAARIAATPAYAAAQDNNHSLSEPAGAFACALLLGDAAAASRAGRALAAAVARLVAPDGGFAQVSPGYARLALDVLSVAELLRRRNRLAPFPAPFASRAAALAAWLHRLVAPEDGTTPRLGVEDGSAFADLSLCGPDDARGSVERAARLFGPGGADLAEDPGCAWLGLARSAGVLNRPARWRSEGSSGWVEAGASAVLRCGPLRFRPAQSDLLHLTLRDGARAILRDAGTGAYNPAAAWWWQALAGAAAHNAPVLGGVEPMQRIGRFLLARWPRLRPLPDGASCRLANGAVLIRRVGVSGRVWTVTDHVVAAARPADAATAMLRWRLPAGPWRLDGEGATDGAIRIRLRCAGTNHPPALVLEQGWESAAYGQIGPCIVLRVEFCPETSPVTTEITLPMQPVVAYSGENR